MGKNIYGPSMVEPIEQGHCIKIQNGRLNQPEKETALDWTWIQFGYENLIRDTFISCFDMKR